MPTNSLKKYLLQICKKYKIYFLALFVISITAASLEIFVHYQIKEIIDAIANNKAEISVLLITFVVLKLVHHGMFFIVRLLDIHYKPPLVTKLTKDMYQKTILHSLNWFDSHMSGEISDKINGFSINLKDLITNIFRSLTVIFAIIIGIVFLAKINIYSAIVQIIFIITYAPLLFFLLRKQLFLQEKFTNSSQETTGIINDSIANIFSIKTIGNLSRELNLKLIPSLLKRQKIDRKTRVFDAFWVDNVDTLMIVIMSAAQIYVLAHLYQQGQITAGGFAFVAMIMLKVHGDIESLIEKILFNINPQIAHIKASYQFVNQEYDITDTKNAVDLKEAKGEIAFENVVFAYNNKGKKVLNDFNLTIARGEKIGLVGHSGAGKTTLVKSLLRYFNINSGAVKVDGHNIVDLTQESLLRNISIIPQDITMFHRSILDNLQIAKDDATKEDIIKACKKAKIHDDIMNMDHGYESMVGERGIKVSGGQRQRIAIARAILKDAPILILDEATSSLDSKTEKLIQESLDVLIEDKSKTVIAIAHRLSTLKHMDRIIVMDNGRVLEEGNHETLIKNPNSLYKKLWELQDI
ncbi:MAG: ABC transporter ATP-binding protein [Rickettsiales bacterium]|nr:ABC transporter ATP-binding protein [Rickettsiales bacterium]